MAVIPVELAGRPYEVRVAAGLLSDLAAQCGPLLRKARVPVVTDTNVASAWRGTVDTALQSAGFEPRWLVLDPGEATKSWAGLSRTVEWLLAEEVERGDHILALGGGVIGDLTGFAAAVLKRGCGFIQLPTSLLAQVDSSVGGKTAINSAAGKNLIGAFHQPSLVLADLDTLETLPARELAAGYAEVIKYGVLGDAEFFAWCETHGANMLAGDRPAREEAVARSVAARPASWRRTSVRPPARAPCSISAIHSAMRWRPKPAFPIVCCTARPWHWAWCWPQDFPHGAGFCPKLMRSE